MAEQRTAEQVSAFYFWAFAFGIFNLAIVVRLFNIVQLPRIISTFFIAGLFIITVSTIFLFGILLVLIYKRTYKLRTSLLYLLGGIVGFIIDGRFTIQNYHWFHFITWCCYVILGMLIFITIKYKELHGEKINASFYSTIPLLVYIGISLNSKF